MICLQIQWLSINKCILNTEEQNHKSNFGYGKITSILVPWILFNFISNPISIIPNIIKKQKQFFILSLIFNLLSLFVFVFAHYLKQDFYFSIKMYSYFMGLNCFVVVVWIIYSLNFINKK